MQLLKLSELIKTETAQSIFLVNRFRKQVELEIDIHGVDKIKRISNKQSAFIADLK